MHRCTRMQAVLMLVAVAAVAASRPVGAQDEGDIPSVLGLTAEQFAARWPGCELDELPPTVVRCGDGVRARLADGRVAEVTKAFNPPVGLIDAKVWTAAVLPSDAEIEEPATIDGGAGIVSERFSSRDLGDVIGTDTIVVRYAVTPDRGRIDEVSVNVEGR